MHALYTDTDTPTLPIISETFTLAMQMPTLLPLFFLVTELENVMDSCSSKCLG